MAEYYHNPEEQDAFEEFRQPWIETTGLQYFLGLRSAALVQYEATTLVMDRFDPNQIVSRVVAIELLNKIWIDIYQLRPFDGPEAAETSWDPFYLDDYTLYDLLWVTLFYYHLTRHRGIRSWGLCRECPFPSVGLAQTREIRVPTYPILGTLRNPPDP